MEILRVALVLAALLACCEAGIFSRKKVFVKEFDKLNDYLTGTVYSDDVTANMDAATRWLPSLKGTQLAAVKQFLDLQGAVGPHKCDISTMEQLEASFAAIGSEKHIWYYKPIRRVDKLVRHFGLEHAKICREEYPKLVSEMLSKMGPEQTKSIQTLMDITLQAFYRDEYSRCKQPSLYQYQSCVIHPLGESHMLSYNLRTRLALREIASEDPEKEYLTKVEKDESGRKYVHEHKIAKLFEKYIYEPCYNMDTQIGATLFKPIKYDLEILNRKEECENVMAERVALGICHFVVHNKEAILDQVISETKSGMTYFGPVTYAAKQPRILLQ